MDGRLRWAVLIIGIFLTACTISSINVVTVQDIVDDGDNLLGKNVTVSGMIASPYSEPIKNMSNAYRMKDSDGRFLLFVPDSSRQYEYEQRVRITGVVSSVERYCFSTCREIAVVE